MKKHRAQSDAPGDPLSRANPPAKTGAAAQGANPGTHAVAGIAAAAPSASVEAVPSHPAQATETRILYYCPVEECNISVSSMADIRSHILEVHSPLLTQGDMMQLVSGLQPIAFDAANDPHETSVQTAGNDGRYPYRYISKVEISVEPRWLYNGGITSGLVHRGTGDVF